MCCQVVLAWKSDTNLMRESISIGFIFASSWKRFLEIPQDFKTKFTLLLVTFVLVKLIETAGSQLLSVLKDLKVLKIFWLSRIDGSSVDISLAITQSCPAFHSLPEDKSRDEMECRESQPTVTHLCCQAFQIKLLQQNNEQLRQ